MQLDAFVGPVGLSAQSLLLPARRNQNPYDSAGRGHAPQVSYSMKDSGEPSILRGARGILMNT
jgi:hypothetical protein